MLSEDKLTFEESLALGKTAEDIIYSYLIAHNSYVQDMRSQSYEGKRGPRLIGTEGELVLPDFAVYNKNPDKGKFLLDSKYKTSIYPVNGKKCFTVDDKFEDYKTVSQIMGMNHLVMAFMFEDKIYFYKDSDVSGFTYFPNQYGTGKVYLFEFDPKKQVY